MTTEQTTTALITSEGVTLGLLAICLGIVFLTSNSSHPFWKRFYQFVPALLICYLLPAFLNTFGIIDGQGSKIYYVISRFFLPAALVLFVLSVDIKKITALGPKALIMFFTGTIGIVIGGPIALLIVAQFSPEIAGNDDVWKGMSTIAGSWIGGGANQTAMKEMWGVSANMFGAMAAIDVIAANIWMAVLLIMAKKAPELDAKRGADVSAIEEVKRSVEKFEKEHARIPQLNDFILIMMIALGATGVAHLCADWLAPFFSEMTAGPVWNFFASMFDYFTRVAPKEFFAYVGFNKHFFWLIVIATLAGLGLSFTRMKKVEATGASKIASVFIYFLVASIGMQMDLTQIGQYLNVFWIGLIWITIHGALLLLVAKWIKAPTFFLAVGSQANVGGAASAPVVAAAFHPSLAPVGALLAILGYVLGTFAAIICTWLLMWVS